MNKSTVFVSRTAEEEIEIEARLRTGKLSLRDLNLTDLPESLFSLTHLVALDLRSNQLKEVPVDILRLRQLKELFLTRNLIDTFPNVVLDLPALELLDISGNRIAEVPDEICNLSSLHHLNVSSNAGITLPATMAKLPRLQEVVAADIDERTIPTAITSCTNLRILNIANNRITAIPQSFRNLKNLRQLHIDTAHLTIPPIEIVSRGPGAIINYLHAFNPADAFTINEAKLLIVGQGGVGKTFLMQRLVSGRVPSVDETTEGISINTWSPTLPDGNSVHINVWDFGGQEIYHSTHQFFLTKRSLYLFIWDSRREDNILNFDYWLNVIKLLSDSSPVVVVQNKVDERVKMIDEVSLTEKFPNIAAFHKVSATRDIGIEDLRLDLVRLAPTLEHFGDTLPNSWHAIRRELEKISSPFISHEDYLGICLRYGFSESEADYLSQYFHDLGVFLHFQDNVILRKIIFLKPEWATNAVYKLIDTREVQEAYGRFSYAMLDSIWQDLPDVRFMHLIELMKRFELCFQAPNSNEYVIPELLNTSRPNFWWNEQDNLHFYYIYDFMPAGILTRLIVRMQGYAKSNTYWKNGVVFSTEGADALVVAHPLQRRISIQLDGRDRGSMLSMIRREIEIIHKSMNNPDVREMLPCSCTGCKESETPYMHDFEYLRKAKARRKWTVECKSTLEEVRVDEILRDVRQASPKPHWQKPESTRRFTVISSNINSDVDETARIGPLNVRRNYSPDILGLTGVTLHQYDAILKTISGLPANSMDELDGLLRLLAEPNTGEEAVFSLKRFFEMHRVPIAQNLSASAIYDLVKYVFL